MGLFDTLFRKQSTSELSKIESKFGKRRTSELIDLWITFYVVDEQIKNSRDPTAANLVVQFKNGLFQVVEAKRGTASLNDLKWIWSNIDQTKLALEVKPLEVWKNEHDTGRFLI